mgnify:CR=1 FL=1
MSEGAIVPGSDAIFASYKKLKDVPVIKHKATQSERLARLANSSNWKAMVEVIDSYILYLKELRSITEKDSVEAVGFRFLASQVAIEYLEKIKNGPIVAKKILTKDEE